MSCPRIANSYHFPQVGAAFGRGSAAVLRGLGEGGELPGGGDGRPVDEPPGVATWGAMLFARGVDARSRTPRRGMDLCDAHVSRDADGLPRHAHTAHRSAATATAQSTRGLARPGTPQRRHTERCAASPRVAVRRVTQWDQSSAGSRLRRDARHSGHQLATATPRLRGLAAMRARPPSHRSPQTLLGIAAVVGVAQATRAAGDLYRAAVYQSPSIHAGMKQAEQRFR